MNNPLPPAELIKAEHYRPAKTEAATTMDHKSGPELYNTGLTADESLWRHKGWAGRT